MCLLMANGFEWSKIPITREDDNAANSASVAELIMSPPVDSIQYVTRKLAFLKQENAHYHGEARKKAWVYTLAFWKMREKTILIPFHR